MHAEDPPPPIASTWVYCDEDHARAEEAARRWMADYYKSTIAHYRFDSTHFAETRDYGYYARIQKHLARSGADEVANGFVALQAWGTPEECAAKIRDIQRKVGCEHVTTGFSYGGMPIEDAERSLRLFAREVIPRLRRPATIDEASARSVAG
jgi:alkanesulfonate monooxygenase SsuD/methylene tetrahydromethanopterin reductase-like flavin-dependent oxidoreductase (luciferase family)